MYYTAIALLCNSQKKIHSGNMFLLFFDVCKINVVIFTRSFQQKDKKTSKLPNKEDHVTYNFEAYK